MRRGRDVFGERGKRRPGELELVSGRSDENRRGFGRGRRGFAGVGYRGGACGGSGGRLGRGEGGEAFFRGVDPVEMLQAPGRHGGDVANEGGGGGRISGLRGRWVKYALVGGAGLRGLFKPF